ncbi:MAG: hypothetical protein JWQ90_3909 [Hydrocarboniphaga sp.]|uniref:hypothetical protein n=1 Tax=Hydrocarboniphaga sp. TaxID=2033016 RepID=UPI002609AFB9|nr:hypothetical protein [Hydrocarboniphaga sp.]MDB5971459.1 hypothetical protein [Hydrocarboniphaga sp.]
MEHETIQLLQATVQTAADSIDICDLEYDVAGVGATEPSHAEDNQAAIYLIHYRTPEQK